MQLKHEENWINDKILFAATLSGFCMILLW